MVKGGSGNAAIAIRIENREARIQKCVEFVCRHPAIAIDVRQHEGGGRFASRIRISGQRRRAQERCGKSYREGLAKHRNSSPSARDEGVGPQSCRRMSAMFQNVARSADQWIAAP
jgi:hypothetical protein